MATPPARRRAQYPLAAYNYRVQIAETAVSFTEVSGLSVEYDHVEYRHGLSFSEGAILKTQRAERFTSMVCKRGTMLGADPLFLYTWLTKREPRTLQVTLADAGGAPVLAWRVQVAVPTRLTAPTFNAAANEVSIDTLELQVRGVSVIVL